jgi:hypothetical protein
VRFDPGGRRARAIQPSSAPFLADRDDADRGHPGTMEGARLLEQPTNGVFGNEVHRVRLQEPRSECLRVRAGWRAASTVGDLDPPSMCETEREDALAEGVHDRGHA